jgi:hypothetical protein
LSVLANTPEGEEVRAILQVKAEELRADLQRLNEYLGSPNDGGQKKGAGDA